MQTKISLFSTKVIEGGWLTAVLAVPLFFNIYTARTFEPDKLTLLRSIVTVMVLAWLVKIIEEGFKANSEETFGARFKRWLKQPLTLPTLAIVSTYIISGLLSISPLVSFWGSYQRMQGTYTFVSYVIMFALMAMAMNSRAQVERFISAIIIASIPVSLYGIIQHNGLDPLPWAGDVTRRVASNMGNAIFVASYLIMIVPITISRLINSLKAIITEEHASWGHTVLAAIYIFAIAVQTLTIIYSQSRGPQIGLLGAAAFMGLALLLVLRQQDQDKSSLKLVEIGQGIGLTVVLGIVTAITAGIGYLLGMGIEAGFRGANLQMEGVTLLGAALGALIGFVGVYAYLAAGKKGWRWMWISWIALGAVALAFVVLLNNPTGPLAPLRDIPYLGRLGTIMDTEGGTGKVRVLIWEGALELVSPHRPLGVEGEYTDPLNVIRPLIGYGPESMFNAFAYAYPPELAQVEARGSSADRSHNETMDTLVMTGLLGFLAFYLLIISIFYYGLKWLGWVPTTGARWRLLGSMVGFGLIGGAIPYFLQGNFTLSPVGLPFGLFGGIIVYMIWQALLGQGSNQTSAIQPVLLIGLLGAFVGHFLEVHFVFSIAATYTYFWAFMAVMLALHKAHLLNETTETEAAAETEEKTLTEASKSQPKRRGKRRRGNSNARRQAYATTTLKTGTAENWDTWIGVQGLVMAIILVILIFDFVPVQFDIATGQYSLVWMMTITYLIGLALTFAETAADKGFWVTPVNWGRAILLYLVTSAGYTAFYALLHSQQRGGLMRGGTRTALQAADGLVAILAGFYIALLLLMLLIGFMLAQYRFRGLPTWRMSNWWLYPPLVAGAVVLIFLQNFNVVRADMYLKEGERYRNAQQWDNAISLHQAAVNIDPDEDFYYLMLALDYQLQAQDGRLDPGVRQQAWLTGEDIAMEARNLNKYNPDNTGNMGRYYFTLGQVLDPKYYDDAIDYFNKVINLAPQNVQYYNLLGKVHYIQGDYETAMEWLEKSVELDARYPPTWLDIGDTYAAQANFEQALEAHAEVIRQDPNAFIDPNFDNRLNFYISSGQTEGLVNAFQDAIDAQTSDSQRAIDIRNKLTWAIGHTYLRGGDVDQALVYLQQAIDNGYSNAQAATELGDAYLSQEKYDEAERAYQYALQQRGANQGPIYSSLGYIYARTNRVPEAIEANRKVLEAMPNDYDSHKNLAILYQQSGDLDNALLSAQAALAAAPESAQPDLETFIAQLEALKTQE